MALAGKAVTRVVRRCHEGQQTQVLDLSSCTLKSFPDAVYFLLRNTNLVTCLLEQNQITKLPTKFFFNFHHLSVLNLRGNRLASLPDEVSRMPDLRLLDISRNRFTTFPVAVLNMPQIQCVDAEDNDISEVDTNAMKRASPSLKEVNLRNNPLSQDIYQQLDCLRNDGNLTFRITYNRGSF